MIINIIYGVALTEVLNLTDAMASNDAKLSYVVNANTFAVSTYRNFNFNSFAKINGRYFGADAAGISELVGQSDRGANINLVARTPVDTLADPLQRIPSENLKNVPDLYVGYSASGDVMLKSIVNGVTQLYTMTLRATAPGLHTQRAVLARGTRSRYWQFELSNVNGGDFAVESITFHPVIMSRHINER
jgi:hypothetical protein